MPTKDHFEIVSEDLGDLEDGDILFETLFVSVDPYQRAYMWSMKPPYKMFGFQVRRQSNFEEKTEHLKEIQHSRESLCIGVSSRGSLLLSVDRDRSIPGPTN